MMKYLIVKYIVKQIIIIVQLVNHLLDIIHIQELMMHVV